jgi:hypothetical protein
MNKFIHRSLPFFVVLGASTIGYQFGASEGSQAHAADFDRCCRTSEGSTYGLPTDEDCSEGDTPITCGETSTDTNEDPYDDSGDWEDGLGEDPPSHLGQGQVLCWITFKATAVGCRKAFKRNYTLYRRCFSAAKEEYDRCIANSSDWWN